MFIENIRDEFLAHLSFPIILYNVLLIWIESNSFSYILYNYI